MPAKAKEAKKINKIESTECACSHDAECGCTECDCEAAGTLLRRTKIVVTIGPSLSTPEAITRVFEAGANVFRCNFSHGEHAKHAETIAMIRKLSRKIGREVTIFVDLQGPKIRISRFKEGKITLKAGDTFLLDAEFPKDQGDQHQVGLDYPELPGQLSKGDTLLLDDGRMVLTVTKISGAKVYCRVELDGVLSNNKGLNKRGGGISAKALTDKDKADIAFASKLEVDYFAVSFPCCAGDMEEAKELIRRAGSKAGVISKIERAEALDALEEIIEASDAVMVARGDLGVEIGDAALPPVQKNMIFLSRLFNKPVITATQMMISMMHSTVPTRAEVFDVANAVYDGTDAVMLSEESATGDHPHWVVRALDRICCEADAQPENQCSDLSEEEPENSAAAVAAAAMSLANSDPEIAAVVTLTETGISAVLLSRHRSEAPILAMTSDVAIARRINLCGNVFPQIFKDLSKVTVAGIAKDFQQQGLPKGAKFVLVREQKTGPYSIELCEV